MKLDELQPLIDKVLKLRTAYDDAEAAFRAAAEAQTSAADAYWNAKSELDDAFRRVIDPKDES